jgi:hypothetical protein
MFQTFDLIGLHALWGNANVSYLCALWGNANVSDL